MQPTPAEMEAAASFTITLILVGAAVFAVVGRLVFWLLERRASSVSDDNTPEITSSRGDRAFSTSTDTSTIPDNARAPYPYLTEYEIVVWLAALKTADSWRYSANKIYTFVGGNRNEVMQWVRSVRGEETPAPPADDEIVTPYAGRRTRASYYPDDPTLEYQPPN